MKSLGDVKTSFASPASVRAAVRVEVDGAPSAAAPPGSASSAGVLAGVVAAAGLADGAGASEADGALASSGSLSCPEEPHPLTRECPDPPLTSVCPDPELPPELPIARPSLLALASR